MDSQDLEAEWTLLDDDELTCVDTVRVDSVAEKASSGWRERSTTRVICRLLCGSSHPAGDLRQPSVKCNQTTVPDVEHAVRALRLKIVEKHAGCSAVAEEARAAASGPGTRPPTDALSALMAASKKRRFHCIGLLVGVRRRKGHF